MTTTILAPFVLIDNHFSSFAVMSNFPEILRAVQKDEVVINQVTNEFSTEFMLNLMGPKLWLQNKKWIEALCQLSYYAATTLSERQTIGEEYTGIVQVIRKSGRFVLPSAVKRLIMVALQTLAPVLIEKLLIPKLPGDRKALATQIVQLVHNLNLMWFYYNGLFHHLSKRFCQIEYAKLNPMNYQHPNLKWIKVLALINGLIILYKFYQQLKKLQQPKDIKIGGSMVRTEKKCPLCLEARSNPTSTICGHIFCWACIVNCIQSKPECPICRETLDSTKIVPLLNYA